MSAKRLKNAILFLGLVVMTACGGNAPAPSGDALLTSLDKLPKELVTVAASETPDQALITPTAQPLTPTASSPDNTATTTPYVGIYMGYPTTAPSGTPQKTGVVYLVTGNAPTPAFNAVSVNPNPGVVASVGGAPTPVAVSTAGAGVVPTNCAIPVATQFGNPYANSAVAARLGCPTGNVFNLLLVEQRFQNGVLFWRETKEMYALSTTSNTFIKAIDSWNETLPASDASFTPPDGLIQPVRGFGYLWRNNESIRNSLGWATAGEQAFTGTWQDFERGWMLTGIDGSVFAMSPNDANSGIHFGAMR